MPPFLEDALKTLHPRRRRQSADRGAAPVTGSNGSLRSLGAADLKGHFY